MYYSHIKGQVLQPEVVQHHPGSAGVHDVAEAQVGHPVQEREDVAPRLLHRQHHNPTIKNEVVLMGLIKSVRSEIWSKVPNPCP